MADNARLHDHEKLIAADEIGNIKHLKVKVQFGEDDAAVQVSSANPLPVTLGDAVIEVGEANVSFGAVSDAFGRLKVSNPYTLFDSSFRYQDNTAKWNHSTTNNSGSVAVNYLPNENAIGLALGTSDGDSIIRETKRVFSYQPGKSLLVLSTFVMATPKANLRQRVGFFGANDGIYFMTEGTSKYFVIRKSTSGSVDDTTEKILQSSWNTDTLDGSGNANNPSGILLDVTRTQIFYCDIEWLGVGTVRAGFVINGEFVCCHKFHHANVNGFTSVYMKTATLPLRYEITNTGVTGSASTMKQICSSVISEGGYEDHGNVWSATSALAGKGISDTAWTPLVSIQLKSNRLDAVVVPLFCEVYGFTNAPYKWALISNPTLVGSNFVTMGADSNVNYDVTASSLTFPNGRIITQGFFAGSAKGGGSLMGGNQLQFASQLGRTLGGVSDILTLAAFATSNNDKAVGSLAWSEHT